GGASGQHAARLPAALRLRTGAHHHARRPTRRRPPHRGAAPGAPRRRRGPLPPLLRLQPRLRGQDRPLARAPAGLHRRDAVGARRARAGGLPVRGLGRLALRRPRAIVAAFALLSLVLGWGATLPQFDAVGLALLTGCAAVPKREA